MNSSLEKYMKTNQKLRFQYQGHFSAPVSEVWMFYHI